MSFNNCSGSGGVAWSSLPSQLISACDDRPAPADRARQGLLPGQGRGVPEFDILEVAVAPGNTPQSYSPPHISQSLQVRAGQRHVGQQVCTQVRLDRGQDHCFGTPQLGDLRLAAF